MRREFGKKIRMSRRELKREHRDNDGDPRMRQKRKELHAIFTKAAKSLRGVKDSDIIITNPFHIAVALRYDGNSMSAPSVTSLGAGGMAQRIRRLGFVYGVVSVRQPALARALHKRCRIGSEIPGDLFQDVANLYLKYGLSKKETV